MKGLLLTRYDRLGASSRMRFLQYLPALRAAGIEIEHRPLLDDAYVAALYRHGRRNPLPIAAAYAARVRALARARAFDFVWIEKELFPYLPPWGERLLARAGVPYVADYDDALFHQYDLHPSPLVRRLLGDKIDRVMRGAALVVAGNSYLAERAGRAGARRVAILPTVVDLGRYPAARPAPGAGFTVGWIGSPATAHYLEPLAAPLRRLAHGGPVRLVVVGADAPEIEGVETEGRPWSEETEAEEAAGFDVGVMPLPDGPWERGKCGYKLIQYMASARAVVASPVGVNREIVEEGRSGFLAADDEGWLRALDALRRDPERRAAMGRAGRRRVEERYALHVAAPRLIELLESVIETRDSRAGSRDENERRPGGASSHPP